jgi:hypothetical protein
MVEREAMREEEIGRRVEYRSVPIAAIRIENRIRHDLGDLSGLADSIQANGQLQPVILDEDLRLLAGERRLRAAIKAGLSEVEARVMIGLSSDEKELVELDENRQRKDFNPHELARYLMEKKAYVKAALEAMSRQQAREHAEKMQEQRQAYEAKLRAAATQQEELEARLREYDARSEGEEPAGPHGPDHTPGLRDIAERMGVGHQTLMRAETHVAALDRYPFLEHKEWSQAAALEVAERLDAIGAAWPDTSSALLEILGMIQRSPGVKGITGAQRVREAVGLWFTSSAEKQARLAQILTGDDPAAIDQVMAYLAKNGRVPDSRRVKLHGIIPQLAVCAETDGALRKEFIALYQQAKSLMEKLIVEEEEKYGWLR